MERPDARVNRNGAKTPQKGAKLIRWEKVGKTVRGDGTTVIRYGGIGTDYAIESRKEQIPHATRPGSWAHTTYAVIRDGEEVTTRYTLKDAKELVEELSKGGTE